MTKSEKRFFKIYSSRHVIGDQNKYVQLFNAIDRQRRYNEALIVRKFKEERFVKRLSVAKAYLYELILRSMNVYYAQQSITAQLRDMLGNIEFLYQKSLYQEARRATLKAQKFAFAYEKIALLPEILRWQKKILEAISYANTQLDELSDLYEQEKQIAQKIDNINEYWWLQARLYLLHNQKGAISNQHDLDSIQSLIYAPLLQDTEKALTYESKLLLYKTVSTYYFFTRDFKNCYEYSKKMIDLLDSRPELLKLDALLYVQSVNNLLNMLAVLHKETEQLHYLSRLRQMMGDRKLQKKQRLQIKLFEAYYYHQLTFLVRKTDFAAGMMVVAEMEEGLNKWQDHITTIGRVMLYFYSFHVCFGAKQFEQAYQCLQKILSYVPNEVRQDIYCFSMIISLLVSYELQNAMILRKDILRCYRFLYAKNKQYQLEHIVLKIIRQLPALTPQDFQNILLPDLQKQLTHLQNDSFERKVFAYFDFKAWIQSQIEGCDFGVILRRKENL